MTHSSNAESVILAFGLLAPLAAAGALWLMRPRTTREAAAVCLAFLWTLPPLLVIALIAPDARWWVFRSDGALFAEMPLELYLGWAFLWGPLAALALSRLSLPLAVAVAFTFDYATMPRFAPVIVLGHRWLIGEAVALLTVFLPAQLLARWTVDNRHLAARVTLQVMLFAGVIIGVVPVAVGAMTHTAYSVAQSLLLQFPGLLGLVALSAVQEFAGRGGGTPFPLDPPRRLVTSGIYRYIRNPMQTATSMGFIAAAAIVRNGWLIAAGALMTIFSAGFARWSEEEDLDARFGAAWHGYRRCVRQWLPRWQPYGEPAATIYIAMTCSVCSPLAAWLRRRAPAGLTIAPAEEHPTRDLTRITYESRDGSAPETGVRAVARALEHLHLGWALAGALMRLPLLRELVQLLADAAGGEPREIGQRSSVSATNDASDHDEIAADAAV
jgi:protein-S-isoprenylcysteine O-methyltransferase Ste14